MQRTLLVLYVLFAVLLLVGACSLPGPRGYVKPDIETIVVDVHTTCYAVKNTNTLSCVVRP